MIKTIIFDIGNVLVDFRWEQFFRKFCKDEKTFQALSQATVKSEQWHELDRGILSDEEILLSFIQNDPSVENEIRSVFQNLDGILSLFDYTIPWIRDLKSRGYQVLVLSNFSNKFHIDCAKDMQFLKETDGGILSYKDKLIKPDPNIYKLLLDRYHLNACECVFLDDLKRNTDAANGLGIQTIHFISKEDADKQLKKLLQL